MIPVPEYISTSEASQICGLNPATLIRLCQQGSLRYFVMGDRPTYRIHRQYLLDWIKAREYVPKKDAGFNPTKEIARRGLL